MRCVRDLTERIREVGRILFMLMEDAMTNTDAHSLYVLVSSLVATAISLSTVWYFTAYASAVVA